MFTRDHLFSAQERSLVVDDILICAGRDDQTFRTLEELVETRQQVKIWREDERAMGKIDSAWFRKRDFRVGGKHTQRWAHVELRRHDNCLALGGGSVDTSSRGAV